MEWLEKNYLIIILVGLFLVFALIGYLIDTARKGNEKNEEDNEIPVKVNEIEIKKIESDTKENTEETNNLLENYDNEK